MAVLYCTASFLAMFLSFTGSNVTLKYLHCCLLGCCVVVYGVFVRAFVACGGLVDRMIVRRSLRRRPRCVSCFVVTRQFLDFLFLRGDLQC